MPITPYHLGPGAAMKAMAPRAFSFSVFTLTQVVIDLETLANVLRKSEVLHQFLHTYAGATLVAAFGATLGRPLCERWLRFWNATLGRERTGVLRLETAIPWRAAAMGAVIGAYSHVVFDSMMHRDIRPWAPWSETNGLFEVIPVVALHWGCLLSGLAGLAILTSRKATEARAGRP